ncbi:MAG TPA: ATP-binding protein [Burkholderiales bacterium]|jgi:C4-dicarboxylate-specific signal transduction histidine kinase
MSQSHERLLDAIPLPLMLVAGDGEILHANPAMQERLGTHGARGRLRLDAPQLAGAHVATTPLGTCVALLPGPAGRPPDLPAAQIQRLAALGFTLAGVCHEVANPLSAIHSMVQILQSPRGVSRETLEKGLTSIAANVSRVLEITRKLGHFSRVAGDKPAPVSIDPAMEEAAALLRHSALGASVYLDYRGAPGAQVLARPGELQQVIFNLLQNAAQAMCGKGRIEAHAVPMPEGRIRLTVRDTGPGIRPEHLERVFEPFFTTKPPDQGTGLGLAISNQIVHELGGTMRAANHAEGGACMEVLLPRYDG